MIRRIKLSNLKLQIRKLSRFLLLRWFSLELSLTLPCTDDTPCPNSKLHAYLPPGAAFQNYGGIQTDDEARLCICVSPNSHPCVCSENNAQVFFKKILQSIKHEVWVKTGSWSCRLGVMPTGKATWRIAISLRFFCNEVSLKISDKFSLKLLVGINDLPCLYLPITCKV